MALTIIQPSEHLSPFLTNRQVGHQSVMVTLPSDLDRKSPRAQANCLWYADPSTGRLLIQADVPIQGEILGEVISTAPVPSVMPQQVVSISAALSCLKTPPSAVSKELRPILKRAGGKCYRSRPIVVPDSERATWLTNKLQKHGFEAHPDTIELSAVQYADLGKRGGGIPYVECRCQATVTNASAANNALTSGIGKGKNFGLGLLRINSFQS